MPRVLIFTDKVLSPTQTFVQSQVSALRTFGPQYVGLSPSVPSLEISGDPILMTTASSGAAYWRKELYKWLGIAPEFHAQVKRAHGDLIHAHFGENGTAAMWLAEATKLPMILSLHGGAEILPDATLRRERYNLPFYVLRSRLWRRASLFICVSEFVRQKALDHGFPPEKLQVHYTGIDCSMFQSAPETRDENLVVFVGRLVRYKAADHLIKAMQIVYESRPNAHAVVIGDGPLRFEHEQMAREMGLHCSFLGHQPPLVVRDWIRRSAVFCAPSQTSIADGRSEALGHVFLEAQAMGVPVVSYRHGGIPEAVRHEKTGLLASEGNISELASYILRYLENPDYRQAAGVRGIEWVRTHFDVVKQTAYLEEIYSRVCETWHGPSLPQPR
jgi:colanic acid/amylovoran biosynthesis glycosyltransferase